MASLLHSNTLLRTEGVPAEGVAAGFLSTGVSCVGFGPAYLLKLDCGHVSYIHLTA